MSDFANNMDADAMKTDEALGRLRHAAHDVCQLGNELAKRTNPEQHAAVIEQMRAEPGSGLQLQIALIGTGMRVEGLVIREDESPIVSLFQFRLERAVRQ